ncbi:hypothetical protein IEO70_12970 [Bacillus sp. AGMB 02131]|uniref:Uncharacterized protein n=1 Tax=Peribacillus faecalis TaxID=2772559 RepID=A0A927D1E0_9BACI|nr:hypothetical protein [Peribacillus faecalis]MBD3109259.1 hypothetical protein [Peribacillus faecalis]
MKKLNTILIAFLSYIGGFAAYNLVLHVVWEQSLGGEWDTVLFWGGLAFTLFAVPIYI